MNYNNNSFPNDNNINFESIEKEDIKEDKNNNKDYKINNQKQNNANNKNDVNKNIFTSLPSKLEIDNTSNNTYESFLIKELINYNLENIFNLIKRKKIIINSKVFYYIKRYSQKKIFLLIKSEILYIKISSGIEIIVSIFKKKRDNKLFQALHILCGGNKMNNHIFKIKYEIKFKNEKDNLINENTLKLKKLEKEVSEMENNIKMLNLKDSELKLKITNLSKKEKQLNETIKQFENSKSSISYNRNSITNNSMYESDIISLESTIVNNKQQKEEKQKIINNFLLKANELLNEYQEYIDILNSNKSSRNNININIELNNKMNSNSTSNDNLHSNKSSLNNKDKDESFNTFHSSKNSFQKQQNNIYNSKK